MQPDGISEHGPGQGVDLRDERLAFHVGRRSRSIESFIDDPPPAFVFDPAVASGDLQQFLCSADREILWRVEPRKVLANDLRGSVALGPFRTGVPGDDVTRRVQLKIA